MGVAAMFFDQSGKKYLDFLGGIAVNALGYSYPDLVRTIRREAGRAVHVSNLFHNPFKDRWQLSSRSGRTWTAYFSRTAAPRQSRARSARAHCARQKSGGTGRRACWRLKIPFMAAVWRSLDHAHTEIQEHLSRSYLEWNLSASTMSRTWKRNSRQCLRHRPRAGAGRGRNFFP